MAIRAREAVVAEFLRKALAVEPLGVAKLDMMARAAGLLGEHQYITQAKLFRRAKDALGIRSVRNGFGKGGGWSWEWPPASNVPATSSARHEPSTPREPVVPREWVQGVARLEQHRPPPDIPRHRWTQVVKDCHAFLNSPEAERAAQLGWRTIELFGCKPNYPFSYLGEAGLLWHVNGGKVIKVHRTWAVIDHSVNRSPHTFYRRDVDPEKITLAWQLRPKR